MQWSRRTLIKTAAGAGAVTALGRIAQASPAQASPQASRYKSSDFRALIGIFLYGGHDGWNMAVPLDGRYDAYRAARGRALALPRATLLPFADSSFGLHSAFAPLQHDTTLGLVLNTGALTQPLSKALYQQRHDLRPAGVMLHDEAESHWVVTRDITMLERIAQATSGALITTDTNLTADMTLQVDHYFTHLSSDIAGQLHRAARMIEARETFDHHHQAFAVSQIGYDTHADQRARQAGLYTDLAQALAAFQAAMAELGLARNVTAFTMSEFGRSYKANWDGGTEHAWGNAHLVLGGAVTARVRGRYPTPVLGGPDDVVGDGRWLPSMSIAHYLAPIADWFGAPEDQITPTSVKRASV